MVKTTKNIEVVDLASTVASADGEKQRQNKQESKAITPSYALKKAKCLAYKSAHKAAVESGATPAVAKQSAREAYANVVACDGAA